MNAQITTILKCFELLGLSVEDIATDQGLEPVAVKAVLMQNSAAYREKAMGLMDEEKREEIVSKSELLEFSAAYKNLARHSGNEFLREKTLRNLINIGLNVTDGLGEQDPRRLLKDANVGNNIVNLNIAIQRAKAAKDAIKNITPQNPEIAVEKVG